MEKQLIHSKAVSKLPAKFSQSYAKSAELSILEAFKMPVRTLGYAMANGRKYDVVDFLGVIITELITFFNIGKNMNPFQIAQTAEIVLPLVGELKVADLRICFDKAKRGDYGKVYDRLDGQVVSEWLNAYRRERDAQIEGFRIAQASEFKAFDKNPLISLEKIDPKILEKIGKEAAHVPPPPSIQEKIVKVWMDRFDKKAQPIGNSQGKFLRGMNCEKYLNYRYKNYLKLTR